MQQTILNDVLSTTPRPARSKNYSDRFIPSRSNSNMQQMLFEDSHTPVPKGRMASDK